jgi:uncharacterized membrane protein
LEFTNVHDFLINALQDWASFYSNHPALRTFIDFFHIGGLLLGGGCAVAADRLTLIAFHQEAPSRKAHLKMLHGTHRVVVSGLVLLAISGLFQFAADIDTYLYSKCFWTKMGLLTLLIINGNLLLRTERNAEIGDERSWTYLRAASIASMVLWFLTTLAGAALPNIG